MSHTQVIAKSQLCVPVGKFWKYVPGKYIPPQASMELPERKAFNDYCPFDRDCIGFHVSFREAARFLP